jgi:hypothetical protein
VSLVEALERHRDLCGTCDLFHVCPVAAALLEKIAAKAAPGPVVIDLEQHKETCLRCRDHALCSVGREIVKQAGEALLEAGRPRETA